MTSVETPTTTSQPLMDGSSSIAHAVEGLASRLPRDLEPLAYIAYNYGWSWSRTGRSLFRRLDPERWAISGRNPVRLLYDLDADRLAALTKDPSIVADAHELLNELERHREEPPVHIGDATLTHPIAYLCAEFAIHVSLPIYSGGLGVLAGDILKEASDARFPMVGVGLLYRDGYFHQRMDASGWQHEYWTPTDPARTPAVLVRDTHGEPLTVSIPLRGRDIVVQIWRVNVGRIPLFLLDAERPENSLQDRWITSRLYVSDKRVRLSQYALLGAVSIRALRAMGYEPAVVHLNEGHGALAPLELARGVRTADESFGEALERIRSRVVFTTHTPVAAGNEGYSTAEVTEVLGDYPSVLGVSVDDFLTLGKPDQSADTNTFVMTPVGLRVSHLSNAVSERHGEVAREMWTPLFPDTPTQDVPITHVTNGVHLPTWMALPMRQLMDRHLPSGWESSAHLAATWAAVEEIPDKELWDARCQLRSELLSSVRPQIISDRLSRNESKEFVDGAVHGFTPDLLTIGFARRMATYKRLHLLVRDAARFEGLLSSGTQILVAGKAHPQDDDGKREVQELFHIKEHPLVAERVAFLDDYDLDLGQRLVAGCDAWINVPRPPMEASGTSGMKVVLNGGLNISILDGWWCEGFDGSNGWSLGADPAENEAAQDEHDANLLYETFERQVVPLFYDRGDDGIPHRWLRMVKHSFMTLAPRFCARRMIDDYARIGYSTTTPPTA